MTQTATIKENANKPMITVKEIDLGELVGVAVELGLAPVSVIGIDARTNMLEGSKLLAGAKKVFLNGLWNLKHITGAVGFDYNRVIEKRSEGTESAKDGGWQQAVLVNGKIMPLVVNKKDVIEAENSDGNTIVKDGAKFYLRYMLLTEAQKAAGFAAKDCSRYVDNDGNEIDAETVKQFFPNRAPAPFCEYRNRKAENVQAVTSRGIVYKIRQAETVTV